MALLDVLAELVGIKIFRVIGHAHEGATLVQKDAPQLGEREFPVRVRTVNVHRAFQHVLLN